MPPANDFDADTAPSPAPASFADAPQAPFGKRRARRALLRTRASRFVLLALLTGLLALTAWYNQHRRIGWRETLSPFYWVARWQGNDLYLPDTAFLKHGSRQRHELALTFDDGPHPESRAQILDTLRRFRAHATFFDVGARMAEQPGLLRRTLAEGHEVANHSATHQRLDKLDAHARHREINDADITYFRLTRRHLNLLRPPGESYNDAVLADTYAKGYIVVGHSTASRDYETDVTPQMILDRTCDRVEDGGIILLHDYPATAQALPAILARLSQDGYGFVTISEMLDHLPDGPRRAALAFQNNQK